MIEIEGRVLAGLDEFMLRAGHLVLLCRVAHDVGGSWRRIHREAVEKLSLPVTVSTERNQEIAEYLASKNLCRHHEQKDGPGRSTDNYRYPDLETYFGPSGELLLRAVGAEHVRIDWQDRNLADRRVRSRVGAISWSAKAGSKTGVSHVCDWAQFLELIDSSGQLSPIGRLLVTVTGATEIPYEQWNPYVLEEERVILAYQYFRKDIDLFSRFTPLLINAEAPLSKSICRELFVQALKACVVDSETSKAMSSRDRFELYQQLRDLERAAMKSNVNIDETSTGWHRTASRVETLTDLGLLVKGLKREEEKYQYIYYTTDRLVSAAESLSHVNSGEEWIENHLVNVTLGLSKNENTTMTHKELLENLNRIVSALKLPTTLLPIGCLALGLVYLNAKYSKYISIYELRKMLEELPIQYPNIARLARGREGTHAEYISLNIRELAEI